VGNRAKPCKFWYVKPVGNFIQKIIAIEEDSHFRRPHCHWYHLSSDRTPTNIGISVISPETTDRGLHYIPFADSTCAFPSILKQSCLKSSKPRASPLNDSTRKTVFNAKWPFKVSQRYLFQCRWKAIGGLHTQSGHNNFGLIYEISKDIATAYCVNIMTRLKLA